MIHGIDPFPHDLIALSASSLNTLTIYLHNASDLALLAVLAPSLPTLRHLHLDIGSPELAIGDFTPALVQLVSHLPHLTTLALPTLWPTQLERVLLSLPPGVALARLETQLVVAEAPDEASAALEGEGGWVAALERCAGLPASAEMEEWDVVVGKRTAEEEPVWWSLNPDHVARFIAGRAGLEDSWDAFRWDAFRDQLDQRGIYLTFWGRPYERMDTLFTIPSP